MGTAQWRFLNAASRNGHNANKPRLMWQNQARAKKEPRKDASKEPRKNHEKESQ